MSSYAILGCGLSARSVIDDLFTRGETDFTVYVRSGELAAARAQFPGVRVTDVWENIREEYLVRSPGVRPDLAPIARAVAGGAVLTGEIEWVCARSPAPVYGVTGSDGKTTTATLAARLFRAMGYRVWLGGNIGTSLLPHIGEILPTDRVVLELSSFQLMTFSPRLAGAAVTNLTENHLDWHRDMAEYRRAKRHILENAARRVQNVRGAIAPELPSLTFSATVENANYHVGDGYLMRGEEKLTALSSLYTGAAYLAENMLCAAALTGAPAPAASAVASAFRGVEHRCEYLGVFRGVHCYDSSIDTTPARTAATLSAFPDRVTVLAGGRNKNLSLAPLADALRRYAAAVVFFGEAGEEMRASLFAAADDTAPKGGTEKGDTGGIDTVGARAAGDLPPSRYIRDFSSAVEAALAATPPGGTLVLSPAAASFDAFGSYRERAEAYKQLLYRLAGKTYHRPITQE